MNQILQVKNIKNDSKKQNKKDMVLFLIILLIIFGLVFGAYLIYQNIVNSNNVDVPEYIPTISLEKTVDNRLIINIESQIELNSFKYNWNNDEAQIIQLEGKKNIEKIIDIPVGENVVYIVVTDINGKETKKQETCITEEIKPQIDLSIIGNYIKITVTSEEDLTEIRYNWNEEEEKVENMLTYEDRKSFEKKLEIPIGKNTLKIIAVNSSGSQTEKTQEIKGVTKAVTTTKVEGEYLHFTVTGNENIKAVEFEYNGKKYLMNENTYGKTKKVHYKLKLIDGMNYLKITTTTESGGTDTTQWQEQYTKE